MEATRATLLARLKSDACEADWEDFYRIYSGVILAYARKLGLSEHAAEDLLQETMVTLMRLLPKFNYNPLAGKFRNYVFTIAHRRVLSVQRRNRRHETVSLDETRDNQSAPLAETLADDRAAAPEENLDQAWKQSLREEAVRRLLNDPTVMGQTLEVFKAYVLENQTAEAVAARFNLKKNNVFQIKNRLIRRLQEEIQLLAGPADAPSPRKIPRKQQSVSSHTKTI